MTCEKKYSSPGRFKITVKIGDENRDVDFNWYNPVTKGKSFITKDKALQDALENTKAFNQFFVLESTVPMEEELVNESVAPFTPEEKTPVAKEGEKLELEVKTVVNLPQAKKWLADNGKNVLRSTKKEEAIDMAAELGYRLEFENKKS